MNTGRIAKTIVAAGAAIAYLSGGAGAEDESVRRTLAIGSSCPGCNLSAKDLSGAVLFGGNFQDTDFSGAKMVRVRILGGRFAGANFRRTDLSWANLTNGNFTGASFIGAAMQGISGTALFANADFSSAVMTEAELLGGNFRDAIMVGTDMSDAKMAAGVFYYADLTRADLRRGAMQGATFEGANLDLADMREGDFSGASFIDANFGAAEVDDALFEYANLSGAKMSDIRGLVADQLVTACGDASTVLPEGLSLTECSDAQASQFWYGASGGGAAGFNLTYRVATPLTLEELDRLNRIRNEQMRVLEDRRKAAGDKPAPAMGGSPMSVGYGREGGQ